MSQIKEQMPTYIMGGSLLLYGIIAQSGALEPMAKYLHTHKTMDLQVTMSLIIGCIAMFGALVNTVKKPGRSNLDTFILQPLGGIVLILVGILAGVVLTNTWGIPKFAGPGVKCARFVLKMGVIMLGARYSFAELAKLGGYSVFLVGFFVLGTVFLVLWLGNLFKQPKSMTGVLSAGMGVCGVSATVAVAPVVKAKSAEMAYTIGTILTFGIICMFVFPTVGKLAGMSPVQFGAWAGTGSAYYCSCACHLVW